VRQQRFGFRRQRTIKALTRQYDRQNLECAKLILASPDEHGGEGSGIVEWARAVIRRLEPETIR
jgi:hypothetical protein